MSSFVTFVYFVLRFLGLNLAKNFQPIIVGFNNAIVSSLKFQFFIFSQLFFNQFLSKSELENDSFLMTFLMKNSVVSFFSNSFFKILLAATRDRTRDL